MAAADQALAAGDARDALGALRPVLDHSGLVPERLAGRDWAALAALLGRVAAGLGLDELAGRAGRVAAEPDAVDGLFGLGYELLEVGLPGMAATVLERAVDALPDPSGAVPDELALSELVVALEGNGTHRRARELLEARPGLLAGSFVLRYLLAFNSVMDGDLAATRLAAAGLAPGDGDEHEMAARIGRMLARADAVAGLCRLDRSDLRGWHFVLTAGLLLHLSPFGLDDGMHGRYAYTQDDDSRCLEGVRRLAAAVDAVGAPPPRVLALPDRDSMALAWAVGAELRRPVAPLSAATMAEPGLVVAYDMAVADGEAAGALAEHRPGQVLWVHAAQWTADLPYAGDLTTYLYQVNVSPWAGGGLRVDRDGGGVTSVPPAEGGPVELAAEVRAAELPAGALDDLPELLGLARVAASAGALRLGQGDRERQWMGGPVPSSRFF
jgi:hypothetical protein